MQRADFFEFTMDAAHQKAAQAQVGFVASHFLLLYTNTLNACAPKVVQDGESAEWFRQITGLLWEINNNYLADFLRETLNDTLELYRPPGEVGILSIPMHNELVGRHHSLNTCRPHSW